MSSTDGSDQEPTQPEPAQPASAAPGWYPQPDGSRWYWDGTAYTDHVSVEEAVPHNPRKPWYLAGAALLAIIVVFGLFALVTHKSPEDQASDACHDYMEARLKAPSTADFSDEYATKNPPAPNPDTKVAAFKAYGTVDSENGFGAKVRTTYVCDVSENYSVIQTKTSEDD